MIEKDLEQIIISKIKNILEAKGISNFTIVGAWQTSDELKAHDDNSNCVIAVKSLPRQYDTPTIPYAIFNTSVSLAVRSDIDYNGIGYVELTDAINDVLQNWQNSFDDAEIDFTTSGFRFTGFELNGGDCGIDKENCVWQFTQSFSVYGIIN